MPLKKMSQPHPSRFLSGPARLSARQAYLLLALMMLLYVLFQHSVALRLHQAFVTSADDLSNIDQVVWNSQHGRILERTEGTRSVPRYGEHLEPIWIAMGLIYYLWDGVEALLLAQSLALAAGALPVFWLARDLWGKKQAEPGGNRPDYLAGLVFAALYLLSPFVGRANSAEVHAMPFAVAPLLLAITWAIQGQWGRLPPLALLLLLVREDAGLLLVALGLWLFVARRAWRPALALGGAGAAGVWLTALTIIPHFASERYGQEMEESIFFERYSAFGEGPLGVAWGMLTRLDLWIELLGEPLRLAFLRDLVGSTGVLALFAPLAWLLLAPHLLLNLLSDYGGQYGGLQHYGAPLVPGLMVAAILGGSRLLQWGRHHPGLRLLLLAVALVAALWTARGAIWQPLARSWIQPPVTAHHRLLAEIVAPIPPLAPLSADPQLHPHLAHRPDAYRFPEVGENAEWIVVDVTTNTTRHPADLRRDLLALLEGEWGIETARDGYLLLRRGAPTRALPDTFFSFGHATAPPAVPLYVRYDNLIELLGYDVEQDFWGRVSIRWHLRPLAPLPPSLTLESALLRPDGTPHPDTTGQPITLLEWHPPSQWEPGQHYLVRTLPREAAPAFQPALTVRVEGVPVEGVPLPPPEGAPPSEVGTGRVGEWLVGGEWLVEHHHARRGEVGWRQWEPSVPLAREPGTWPVARLGAWSIERVGERLHVTLHWQATTAPLPPTQRFLHLVPGSGPPVPLAQVDGPLGGDYPAPGWQRGEWVTSRLTLEIPPGAPDELRLLVGLYEPQGGARLPVEPDAGDATFDLGPVEGP